MGAQASARLVEAAERMALKAKYEYDRKVMARGEQRPPEDECWAEVEAFWHALERWRAS